MSSASRDLDVGLRLFRSIFLIRRVEEEIVRLYPSDKIKSPVHLSIGQEAVSAAVCDHLRREDVAFGTYRGHALYLAKGGDLSQMIAELYGKADGCGRGKAGSMHLSAPSVNMMGTSAIVATGISNAVGAALALKMTGQDAIVVCFFGEGAIDEGAFHESLNFASLRKLPVLFVCENNQYAIYSHYKDRLAGGDICARVRPYDVPAICVDGTDALGLHNVAGKAIAAVRDRKGPQFLECTTYRWRDHVGPDEDRRYGYRSDVELDTWIGKDSLMQLGKLLPEATRKGAEREIEERIASAIAYAEQSSFPEASEMGQYVFSS